MLFVCLIPCLFEWPAHPARGESAESTNPKICYVGLQTGQCIPSSAPAPVLCDTLLILKCFADLEPLSDCFSGGAAIRKQHWHRYPSSAMVAVNVTKSAKCE